MATNRNLVFDALKLFAIFMVLWGHAIPYLHTGSEVDNPVSLVIYSFHMPLFMTIVGFFSGSVDNMSLWNLIKTKGRQLILPALVFSLPLEIGVCIKSGVETALHSYIGAYWFLKSAFFCFLIYYIGEKMIAIRWLMVVLTVIISLSISDFNMDRMYPCFLLGVLIRKYHGVVKSCPGRIAVVSGAVFIAMLPFFFNADVYGSLNFSPVVSLVRNGLAEYIRICGFFYGLIIGMVGSVFFISLFEYLSLRISWGGRGRKIAMLGSETLGVYLLQTVLLELPPKYVGHLDGINGVVYDFVVTPLISLAVLLLSLYIIKQIKKSRWLAFLVLGKPLVRPETGN